MDEELKYRAEVEEHCENLSHEGMLQFLGEELASYYSAIFSGHGFNRDWDRVRFLQEMRADYLSLEPGPDVS